MSNPYRSRILAGEEYFQEGRIEEALAVFREVLEQDPENVEALNDVGVAHIELNEYSEAQSVLQQALQVDSSNHNAFFNLLDAYISIGKEEKAKDIYQVYEQCIPSSPEKSSYYEKLFSDQLVTIADKPSNGRRNPSQSQLSIPPTSCNDFYQDWLLTKEENEEVFLIRTLMEENWDSVNVAVSELATETSDGEIHNTTEQLKNGPNVNHLLELGKKLNLKGLFRSAYVAFSKASTLSPSYKVIENFSKKSSIYHEEMVRCDVCGADNEIFQVKPLIGRYTSMVINPVRLWRKCKNCGLCYISPRPTDEVLPIFYEQVYQDTNRIKRELQRINHLTLLSRDRLEIIRHLLPDGQTLLDVGGGIGVFASIANDMRFNPVSLDLNASMSEFVSRHLNIPAENADFLNFDGNQRQFDVITSWETLEHVISPHNMMQKVSSHLKPGGVWAFATPVYDSTFGKIEDTEGVWWVEPGHLYYFSRESIETMLKHEGFELEYIRPSSEGMGRMEYYAVKVR